MVESITEQQFQLDEDGCLPVPESPGLGVEVDRKRLKELEESGFSAASWTWEEDGLFEAR
jgi:L-alanine-DL-glutamate epimerase-like enolase superfamily enzyme